MEETLHNDGTLFKVLSENCKKFSFLLPYFVEGNVPTNTKGSLPYSIGNSELQSVLNSRIIGLGYIGYRISDKFSVPSSFKQWKFPCRPI